MPKTACRTVDGATATIDRDRLASNEVPPKPYTGHELANVSRDHLIVCLNSPVAKAPEGGSSTDIMGRTPMVLGSMARIRSTARRWGWEDYDDLQR